MGDALLYTMGRQGNTDSMDLSKVDLEADGRGLLEVSRLYAANRQHFDQVVTR